MTERHFLWGLSGGISVFAISGAFWLGLGFTSVLTPRSNWRVWALVMGVQAAGCVALLWSASRLRRRSGFAGADVRRGDEQQRAEARRMRAGFGWTTAGQTVLIGLGVWWCVRTNAMDQIWPWIGLVVSVHLIPLARVFHVRAYYVTAGAGTVISLVALSRLLSPYVLATLGGGLAAVMWLSATYLVWSADKLASGAARERWAV